MKTKWRSLLNENKASKKKNTVTIPKDVFPKLLKKLILELPNQDEKIKSGFRICGISPLDKATVLDRLPQEANESANNSVSEVFTEHLRQLRHGDDGAPRKMRRRKLDVVPGRSIAASHSEAQGVEASAPSAEPEAEEGASAMDGYSSFKIIDYKAENSRFVKQKREFNISSVKRYQICGSGDKHSVSDANNGDLTIYGVLKKGKSWANFRPPILENASTVKATKKADVYKLLEEMGASDTVMELID
ncbi:tigger transposable element-derived protein 2 [Elysia marginata]|uniref:Tigger transposable element-derived protein 2 n=1 Tax=Elysia marginata TaxID=1093978 RepID=A0AAV4GYJ8_9GAST|nr:tigger transposable element-derived protein 2 [Elysia marginata]